MATQIALFSPTGATVKVSATTSSANAAIAIPVNSDTLAIKVANASGLGVVHVKWGTTGGATLTATTDDMPLGEGDRSGNQINERIDRVAVITSAGTCDVYFTPGVGS